MILTSIDVLFYFMFIFWLLCSKKLKKNNKKKQFLKFTLVLFYLLTQVPFLSVGTQRHTVPFQY